MGSSTAQAPTGRLTASCFGMGCPGWSHSYLVCHHPQMGAAHLNSHWLVGAPCPGRLCLPLTSWPAGWRRLQGAVLSLALINPVPSFLFCTPGHLCWISTQLCHCNQAVGGVGPLSHCAWAGNNALGCPGAVTHHISRPTYMWLQLIFHLQTKLSDAMRCCTLVCVWSAVGGWVNLGHHLVRSALLMLKTQLQDEKYVSMYARREKSFIANYPPVALLCTLCQAKGKTQSKQLWDSSQRFHCVQFLQISVAIPKFPSTFQTHAFATQEYLFFTTVLSQYSRSPGQRSYEEQYMP